VKRFTFPLIILLILLVAFLYTVNPGGWFGGGEDAEDEAAALPVLVDLGADQVTAFEFTKPDGVTIRLERDGEHWQLSGNDMTYRARTDKVDKLLEEVPGLAAASVATQNPQNYETYEVDDAKATTLLVFGADGTTEIKLLVGKAAPGYTSAFVRLESGPEVFRTNKNVRSPLAFAFDDYRTKKPWEFNQLSADTLRVRPLDGEGDYRVYKREDGVWKTADGENANQNAVTELVDKLTALSISTFEGEAESPEASEAAGTAGVEPQIMVSGSEGTYSLTIGTLAESQQYVADQDGHLYKLGEASLRFYTELDLASLDIAPDPETADAPVDGPLPEVTIN
jgi:hypothetical protein